jgi:Fe-S-cluster-containing dehydrogenase component/formate-dependent nitrite reductase membrane component NrfD
VIDVTAQNSIRLIDLMGVTYAFIIDNRRCIGCHSCTVACKAENKVPLGVNRTWVKYVEKGRFPHVGRVFQVTRCNHCEKPSCVEICPVGAMYRRKDGIVDFNSARCIGCKGCMQACPYDAIYIDPDRNTAAKCHFCAHRIEAGLEPACVSVCPEHAIVAGDLDESDSEIAQLLARETTRVRKPEQGTRPKLYYIDADESTMVPTTARHESFYMWAERNRQVRGGGAAYMPNSPLLQAHTLAAYDVGHDRPWGWQVPVYFWMKTIASGLLAVPAIGVALRLISVDRARDTALSALAVVLMAATVMMLVSDLSHKRRFLKVLVSPRFPSWISKGAFCLVIYSVLCGALWVGGIAGLSRLSHVLLWPTVLAGFLAAGYTAFLFGQCEGRDLWQTSLLPAHVIVQALLASAAVLVLLPAAFGGSELTGNLAITVLWICLVFHLLMIVGEVANPAATDSARYASWLITRGPYAGLFWVGSIALGGVVPLLLLLFSAAAKAVEFSCVLALGGLLAFEWCFVMAGQRVPNS